MSTTSKPKNDPVKFKWTQRHILRSMDSPSKIRDIKHWTSFAEPKVPITLPSLEQIKRHQAEIETALIQEIVSAIEFPIEPTKPDVEMNNIYKTEYSRCSEIDFMIIQNATLECAN